MTDLEQDRHGSNGAPPEAIQWVHRSAWRMMQPIQRFLHLEAASGVLLLIAAAVAMLWANSPWAGSYEALWTSPLGFKLGPFAFERDLRFWVNDGLMTLFFFVVGLEIRREIHRGELSQLRRAALPLVAALGGMIAPAGIYLLWNSGGPAAGGWGVPMATDIAFAVGIMALLGSRVPSTLRVLLLAVAVIDDLGAILVIAFFYSSGISATGLAVVGLGLSGLFAMRWLGVRSPWAYVVPGLILWAGTYAAGVHPTLAGVALGLLTPVSPWWGRQRLAAELEMAVGELKEDQETTILETIGKVQQAQRETVSVVERLEHALHGWVAFLIMPLFAFANAGVPISAQGLQGESMLVIGGVVTGLVLGKPLGVLLFSWVAVRFGAAVLPTGVTWKHLLLLGVVAGIGFTMALFIAQLAFADVALLEAAKLGILIASGVAGISGLALGFLTTKKA